MLSLEQTQVEKLLVLGLFVRQRLLLLRLAPLVVAAAAMLRAVAATFCRCVYHRNQRSDSIKIGFAPLMPKTSTAEAGKGGIGRKRLLRATQNLPPLSRSCKARVHMSPREQHAAAVCPTLWQRPLLSVLPPLQPVLCSPMLSKNSNDVPHVRYTVTRSESRPMWNEAARGD